MKNGDVFDSFAFSWNHFCPTELPHPALLVPSFSASCYLCSIDIMGDLIFFPEGKWRMNGCGGEVMWWGVTQKSYGRRNYRQCITN